MIFARLVCIINHWVINQSKKHFGRQCPLCNWPPQCSNPRLVAQDGRNGTHKINRLAMIDKARGVSGADKRCGMARLALVVESVSGWAMWESEAEKQSGGQAKRKNAGIEAKRKSKAVKQAKRKSKKAKRSIGGIEDAKRLGASGVIKTLGNEGGAKKR